MCITPETVEQIVNNALDRRDAIWKKDRETREMSFWKRVNDHMTASIQAKLAHNTTAPATELRLQQLQNELNKNANEQREHWETIRLMHMDVQDLKKSITENTEATGAVRDLLAGGRILRAFAQFLSWTGIIVASFFAIYHFLKK